MKRRSGFCRRVGEGGVWEARGKLGLYGIIGVYGGESVKKEEICF